jgi:hypothetical protein
MTRCPECKTEGFYPSFYGKGECSRVTCSLYTVAQAKAVAAERAGGISPSPDISPSGPIASPIREDVRKAFEGLDAWAVGAKSVAAICRNRGYAGRVDNVRPGMWGLGIRVELSDPLDIVNFEVGQKIQPKAKDTPKGPIRAVLDIDRKTSVLYVTGGFGETNPLLPGYTLAIVD